MTTKTETTITATFKDGTTATRRTRAAYGYAVKRNVGTQAGRGPTITFHHTEEQARGIAGKRGEVVRTDYAAPEEAATELLLAVTADGTAYRLGEPMTWGEAQDAWLLHDDARLAGRRPHVRYYAVRSAADPDPRWQGAKVAAWPFRGVVGSRGYGDGQGRDGGREKAARHAIRRRIPNPGNPSGIQGMGGWYYHASGRPLAQGLDDLARVAIRHGWIAQAINGRWFVICTAPEEA